jgi:hypothetical protein
VVMLATWLRMLGATDTHDIPVRQGRAARADHHSHADTRWGGSTGAVSRRRLAFASDSRWSIRRLLALLERLNQTARPLIASSTVLLYACQEARTPIFASCDEDQND